MKNFIKRIWDWIVSIPKDKLLHDYAGELITMFGFVLFYLILPFWAAFGAANLLALVILVAKEVYDSKMGGTPEVKDILFGLFGMAKFDAAALILAISIL